MPPFKNARASRKRTLFTLAIFFVCVLSSSVHLYNILKVSLHDVRYSKFYVPRSADQLQEEHSERVERANNYFSQLPAWPENNNPLFNSSAPVDVCVAIASVDRSPHQYLTITLASVLKGVSDWEREKYNVQVFVLDNEPEPQKNLEAKELFGMYQHLYEVVQTNEIEANSLDWTKKEVLDYARALRLCDSVSPKISIILEDDTMATNHYIDKLKNHLDQLPRNAKYMDIKLFYPDYYCGFSKFQDVLLLVLFAIITSMCMVAAVWKACFRGKRAFQTQLLITLMFLYLLSVCIIVPLIIGKQNILWCWKFGITPFTATSCTTAVAYPTYQLDFLASQLEARYEEDNVDLLLDKIAEENNFNRYIISPNLFQHIGLFSSNSNKNQGDDLKLKTSMSFVEDY